MPSRSMVVAVLALALAVGLAACGEKEEQEPAPPTAAASGGNTTSTTTPPTGGGGGKVSPGAQIEANVATVVGGGDPQAACAELVTARYVRQAYGDEQGCRAAVSSQKAFDVAVTGVEIQGATAAARARPAAGPNKAETLKVELVQDGKTWKVDSAISNAPAGP
jgi:hypothetical protein